MTVALREDINREAELFNAAIKVWRRFDQLVHHLEHPVASITAPGDDMAMWKSVWTDVRSPVRCAINNFLTRLPFYEKYPGHLSDVAHLIGAADRGGKWDVLPLDKPLRGLAMSYLYRRFMPPSEFNQLTNADYYGKVWEHLTNNYQHMSPGRLANVPDMGGVVNCSARDSANRRIEDVFRFSREQLEELLRLFGNVPEFDTMLDYEDLDAVARRGDPHEASANEIDVELSRYYPRDFSSFINGIPAHNTAASACALFQRAIRHTTTRLDDRVKSGAIELFTRMMQDGANPLTVYFSVRHVFEPFTEPADWVVPEGYFVGGYAALIGSSSTAVDHFLDERAPMLELRSREDKTDDTVKNQKPVSSGYIDDTSPLYKVQPCACPVCAAEAGVQTGREFPIWSVKHGRVTYQVHKWVCPKCGWTATDRPVVSSYGSCTPAFGALIEEWFQRNTTGNLANRTSLKNVRRFAEYMGYVMDEPAEKSLRRILAKCVLEPA